MAHWKNPGSNRRALAASESKSSRSTSGRRGGIKNKNRRPGWKMDPHGLYSSVCALMVCLLGATRLSSGDKCKCPEIPPKDLTVREGGCFNSTYRYRCIPGYTRKAGTINFIKCQETNGVFQWTESTLECIIDPNYEPPPATTDKCKCPEIPPKDLTVREGGCFNSTYRYRCIPGYTRKAGTINFIKCQETNGVFQWTESTLECIIDPNYEPPPATTAHPEFQTHPMISREAPPGPSSTSKPSAPPKKEQSILGPSSTLRTSTSNPSPSPHTLERTTICISLIGVVLLIVCGVFFFLCRQRNKPKPPRDPQEREAELLTKI